MHSNKSATPDHIRPINDGHSYSRHDTDADLKHTWPSDLRTLGHPRSPKNTRKKFGLGAETRSVGSVETKTFFGAAQA